MNIKHLARPSSCQDVPKVEVNKMKARNLIEESSFGPEALKVVGIAFDRAWEDVEFKFTTTQAKEEARTLSVVRLFGTPERVS
jgi:hypothetical protein